MPGLAGAGLINRHILSFLAAPAAGNGVIAFFAIRGHLIDGDHLGLFYAVAAACSGVALISLLGFLFRDLGLNPAILGSAIQAVLLIAIFAGFYKSLGLMTGGHAVVPSYATALYFSIVTWTTLGYGDYTPTASVQLVAAAEAMMGYVFSGILIGALLSQFEKLRKA